VGALSIEDLASGEVQFAWPDRTFVPKPWGRVINAVFDWIELGLVVTAVAKSWLCEIGESRQSMAGRCLDRETR